MSTITARVRGHVSTPEHPEREGALGLVGAEDVTATRDTFRSVGEGMTWARRVLDGAARPRRVEPAGPLDGIPHGAPTWGEAEVVVDNADRFPVWVATTRGRSWVLDTGETVRTDPEPEPTDPRETP